MPVEGLNEITLLFDPHSKVTIDTFTQYVRYSPKHHDQGEG